jgi:hypothetical protein
METRPKSLSRAVERKNIISRAARVLQILGRWRGRSDRRYRAWPARRLSAIIHELADSVGYSFVDPGFHSRARRCPSTICAADIPFSRWSRTAAAPGAPLAAARSSHM